jgi:NTE family protein
VERKDGRLRVAIACEGGGSHTAFTAGALSRLLRDPRYECVALSGTSGGAVCAALAWRGLLDGGVDEAVERVEAFWTDNETDGLEAVIGALFLDGARALGELLSWEVSPYRLPFDARKAFTEVLDRHGGFAEIPRLLTDSAPRLLIGASDVRSGEFAVFRSHPVEHRSVTYPATRIDADVLLASAAVPTIFRAVEVDGRDHWDGVFSQNPPVRELPDMVRTMPGNEPPDEIWIVRINPQACDEVPHRMSQIRDRRNELAGIISLSQELYMIGWVNRLVERGYLGDEARTKHRVIKVRSLAMAADFAAPLDYESKLDRSRPFLRALREHGARQADEFLHALDGHLAPRPASPPRREAPVPA